MTVDPGADEAHRELRESLGAYVLGQLSPLEAEALRTHLGSCAPCRAELAELQPVAGALASARRRPVTAGPTPPGLEARISGAISAEAGRRRRATVVRTVTSLGVAAALVVVAVLGVRTLGDDGPSAPVPTAIEVQVAPDRQDVTATAGIIAHTWGVEVKLTAVGFTAGENFEAYVVEDDGEAVPAGTFVGVGANTMNCNLQSFVTVDRAQGFEIRDDQDNVVLTGDF